MIDSGATNSFLNQTFLDTTRIPKVQKDIPLEIQVIDGRPISSGAITHHTAPVKLLISGHEETISLDITSLGHYPVILGLPWLSQHNPHVDWTRQSIVFSSQHCLAQCIQPVKLKGGNSGGFSDSRQPAWCSHHRYATTQGPATTSPEALPVQLPATTASGGIPSLVGSGPTFQSSRARVLLQVPGSSQGIPCERSIFPCFSQEGTGLWDHQFPATRVDHQRTYRW